MPVTPSVLAAVGYLGVFSTAVAWYCWYEGLGFVDAETVAMFFFAQPVVGAVLGASFLGDRVAPEFVVGGGLTGVGIYLVSTDAGIAEWGPRPDSTVVHGSGIQKERSEHVGGPCRRRLRLTHTEGSPDRLAETVVEMTG